MNFKFIFNKKKYNLNRTGDLTLIQVAELLGLVIPRFCYHNSLSIAGNCRMCLIEVNTSFKPIVACGFSLTNNLKINTNTKKISIIRESILEFLLINHPLDCPICDSAGECDLQDISLLFGNDLSRFKENKRTVSDKNFGDFIKTIMTRCIHCTRCIRFIDEYMFNKNGHIGTLGRGVNTIVSNYFNHSFEHDLSGNLADLCPVGALTHKTYAFTARPWELNSIEYYDFIDIVPMNIRIDLKGNDIYRIIPIYTDYLQDEFISNRTRYFYDVTFDNIKGKTPVQIKKNFIKKEITNLSWSYFNDVSLIKNTQVSFNSDDIYTYQLMKYFALSNDFKNVLNSPLYNLRSSYLKHKHIFDLPKEVITNMVQIKKKSTMLSLKLEKDRKKVNTIGPFLNTFSDYNQIGISKNIYKKIENAKSKYSKLLRSSFYNLILSDDSKMDNHTTYLQNNINDFISKEIGAIPKLTMKNKYIKESKDSLMSFNERHTNSFGFTNVIAYTPFFKPHVKYHKHNKDSMMAIVIPTLNNLNQNITFWNMFGHIRKNPQIIKSGGFDDFTMLKQLIKKTTDIYNYYCNYKNYNKLLSKTVQLVNTLTSNYLQITFFKKNMKIIFFNEIKKEKQNNYLENNNYIFYSKYLNNAYIYTKKYKPIINNVYSYGNVINFNTNVEKNTIYTHNQNFYDYKVENKYNKNA